MFNFFKKKTKSNDNIDTISKITSLLIHAAKIDENYTENEKQIIKKTILELGTKEEYIDEIMKKAEQNEQKSNQILEFTKEIKNKNEEFKIKIIESLWKIIYSDKNSDIYEANLMRRLSGLLYIDSKIVGKIKERIKIINNK